MTIDIFNLLSKNMRKFIFNQKWTQFSKIQTASIQFILENPTVNTILIAPTAGGKTEAVFLPVITLCFPDNTNYSGVKILYISPLKALINDQWNRISTICNDLTIPITSWHGDASDYGKKIMINEPEGIILITPESLEALCTLKPKRAKKIFEKLEYIIIDEFHSFIGEDRGVQLLSVIDRLSQILERRIVIHCLSATLSIESFEYLKKIFSRETKIIYDSGSKDKEITLLPYKKDTEENKQNFISKLSEITKNKTALIFPNSKSKVEQISGDLNYSNETSIVYAHHGSLSKDERQYVEEEMKNSKKNEKKIIIVATSTLEMGIDIGSVETVIQIDLAPSVTSLTQRAGRGGRREDITKLIYFYEPSKLFSFLKVSKILLEINQISMYYLGILEPLAKFHQEFYVYAHQVLAIIVQHHGINREIIFGILNHNFIFRDILKWQFDLLIEHLIVNNYIMSSQNEFFLAKEGEKLVFSGSFWSVFESKKGYKVYENNKLIGEIDYKVELDEEFYLSGRTRVCVSIDNDSKKIFVKTKLNSSKEINWNGIFTNRLQWSFFDNLIKILNDLSYTKQILNFNDLDIKNYLLEWGKYVSKSNENTREIFVKDQKMYIPILFPEIDKYILCYTFKEWLENENGPLIFNKVFVNEKLKNMISLSLLDDKLLDFLIEKVDLNENEKLKNLVPKNLIVENQRNFFNLYIKSTKLKSLNWIINDL